MKKKNVNISNGIHSSRLEKVFHCQNQSRRRRLEFYDFNQHTHTQHTNMNVLFLSVLAFQEFLVLFHYQTIFIAFSFLAIETSTQALCVDWRCDGQDSAEGKLHFLMYQSTAIQTSYSFFLFLSCAFVQHKKLCRFRKAAAARVHSRKPQRWKFSPLNSCAAP